MKTNKKIHTEIGVTIMLTSMVEQITDTLYCQLEEERETIEHPWLAEQYDKLTTALSEVQRIARETRNGC